MTTPVPHDQETNAACPWCIDGFTPIGVHPDLGPVFRMCPTDDWCDVCGDYGLFPADFMPLDERINALLHNGLATVWCPNCLGITSVIPLTNNGGIR
ncbi:hypothetical protein [Actinoplanes sp. NPDC049118]|uniref:hypothetical protein n=1 Tax=Actinoplanes sp. NPDC049118 TaxID=3155769 RepID=UPI0033F81193